MPKPSNASAPSGGSAAKSSAPPLRWWKNRWFIALRTPVALLVMCPAAWFFMIRMPGKSHVGPLPALTPAEAALSADLRRDVVHLATQIGDRNVDRPKSLSEAADFMESSFKAAGYEPQRQTFEAAGYPCSNIDVEKKGSTLPAEIVLIGAHYDSARYCPAANDNGTGAAAVLALARAFATKSPARTVRFVAFTNEEPPQFQGPIWEAWSTRADRAPAAKTSSS